MRCNFAKRRSLETSIWFDLVRKDLLIRNKWWLCLRRERRLLILEM